MKLDNEYMSLLTDGVGRYSKATKVNVAIIGAGMAGLVAGRLLVRAGFNVRIYEASHRVGGRIKTLREGFTHGLYAEAGAMRIPNEHKLTRKLCSDFKCRLIPFEENSKNALVYLNGHRVRREDYEAGRVDFGDPYTKCSVAKNLIDRVLQPIRKLFHDGMKELQASGTLKITQSDELLRLDNLSWGEYLRGFVKCSSSWTGRNPVIKTERIPNTDVLTWADLDLIRFEYGAADFRASLLEFIRDDETIGSSGKEQIAGGMDLLPTGFVDPARSKPYDLSGHIQYHARVQEIIKAPQGHEYEIRYEHTLTHSLQSTLADYVILAAPFSALTHVRLKTVLPPESLHAIRTLHYENAAKIILEFSERFWQKQMIFGGKSFSDLPIRWTHYPTETQWGTNKRGLLLASYTWGDDSLRWGSLNEEDRIRFALRDIAELHNVSLDECRRLLVGGMSHSWARDEYTFGAFAIFEPHQERELYRNTWRHHEGIHFAGEHTSLKHAWIEGAVESGIRAAKEIFDSAEGPQQ